MRPNKLHGALDYYETNDVIFNLPFFDNFGDNYTVVVWARGCKQAGFAPVILSDEFLKTVDIMFISDEPGFSFADARWDAAKARYPFLESDVDDAAGAARYNSLRLGVSA